MSLLDVNIDFNMSSIQQKFDNLINDEVMLEIHNAFAKMCDPYVPMDEGVLAQSVIVEKDHIRYPGPYAHYQYVGEVYGPNIPITENGIIVGWFSPPGKKKHPTGRAINYGREKHPLASKEWDKAMMTDKGDVFTQQVKDILVRRAKQLYG